MEAGLARAKLKKPIAEWHEYLVGKELLVGEIGGNYNLLAIENQDSGKFTWDFNGLCEFAWGTQDENEREYETLEEFQEAVSDGNDGFGFDSDEIEILGGL